MMNLNHNNSLLNSVFSSYLYLTIFATLSTVLGFICNGLVIGNLIGASGMSAYGITTPIIYGNLGLSYIFSTGGSIVCSNNMNNHDAVDNNFSISIILSVILGLIITIVLSLMPTTIASFLGASGDVLPLTSSFMSGIFLSLLPMMLSMILINYSRIDGFPDVGLKMSVIITASNLILDLVFIYGHWGIFGVGLATALSYIFGDIYGIMHFFSKKSSFNLIKPTNFGVLREIVFTGIPSALNQVYNMVRTTITNNLGIFVGGMTFVSALSIQSNVYMLLCAIGIGIGNTAMALGGVLYGERDRTSLVELLRIAIKKAFTLVTVISAILFIFAPVFVSIFGRNQASFEIATRGLRIFAFSLPFSGLCYIFLNVYNSIKQLKFANYIGFAHSFLFLSLAAIALTFTLGGDGLWLSFTVGELLTLLGLTILIRIQTGKFPKSISDFIIMEDDQFPPEDVLHVSISSRDELMTLIRSIDEALKDTNLSKKTLHKIQLTIEEIGVYILDNGYEGMDKKYIDIRVKYKNTDDIILYFQDNGRKLTKKEFTNNITGVTNYGYVIVNDISKSIAYARNVDLNNTKINIEIEN